MSEAPTEIEDGRRARRRRNRDAVIDALFDLLNEQDQVPAIDAIAARAGVSVSSVFRYFEGLDDLRNETIERYFTRYEGLFAVPDIGTGTFQERLDRFVDARIRLYDAIGPIARLARAKAYDQPRLAAPLALARATFRDQIREHFAAELTATDNGASVTSGQAVGAEDRVVLVDSLTSFESWDLQHTTHQRSNDEVRASWRFGVARIVTA